MGFNLHHLFFIQIVWLQFDKGGLCSSGLSSEGQSLPSESAGSEVQQAAGFRRGAAV